MCCLHRFICRPHPSGVKLKLSGSSDHLTTLTYGFLTRFTVGMSFSVVYGALLTKTNRISRIFHSAAHSARRTSYISPRSQLIITAVLVSVQFGATLFWVISAFPGAHKVYPERDEVRKNVATIYDPLLIVFLSFKVILKCNVNDSSFLISQLYNMLLISVCTYYAIKTRKVPENFNEAKFIGFTMYTTCVIWLAFIPIYFGTGNSFEVCTVRVGKDGCHAVTIRHFVIQTVDADVQTINVV